MLLSRVVRKGLNVVVNITVLTFLVFSCLPPAIAANLPEGATIQAGQGWIDATGNVMNVNQWTDQMIVDWISFCIAHGYTVNFLQPGSDSIALNRVTGGSISEIFGNLNANGRVWLLNPNGILFGPTAKINTAGFLASTLHMSNEDFLNKSYIFTKSSDTPGYIINKGDITITDNGYVALMGDAVKNDGVIQANLGKVILASGEKIALDLDSEGTISVVIEDPVSLTEAMVDDEGNEITDAVRNSGTILSDGGTVVLTSSVLGDVFKSAVNNDGTIQAQSLVSKNGEVYLLAKGENGLVSTTGSIDVSAHGAGVDGGYVEVCGDRVVIDGDIDVTAVDGTNGELFIDPLDLYIIDYDPGWFTFSGPNGTYEVPYDGGPDLGSMQKSWMEAFVGSLTLRAKQDVIFRIGEEYQGSGVWSEEGRPDTLNLSGIGDGDFFRIETGRHVDFGDDFISTGGGDMLFYADYDVSGDGIYANGIGQIFWSEDQLPVSGLGWNGGLNSNGGDIVFSGEDVDLYWSGGGNEFTADINAGSGTVYFAYSGSTFGYQDPFPTIKSIFIANRSDTSIIRDTNHSYLDDGWVYGEPWNDYERFVLPTKGLENITAGTIVLGKTPENGIRAANIKIQNAINLTTANRLELYTGSIPSHGYYYGVVDENSSGVDISVNDLYIEATGGIGSSGTIETNVNTFSALNKITNDIRIDNTGDVTLESVVNNAGDVYIVTHSDMSVGNVEAIGNTVTLTADGAIVDGGDADADITAATADLSAADGIGSGDALETAISTLIAENTATNNVEIANTGDLTAGVVNSGADVNIAVASDLTVENIETVGTATLSASGAIIDGGDGSVDILADTADLTAEDGIGSGNAIETQINTLIAENTITNNIRIDNTGNLSVEHVAAVNAVTLSTDGAITDGDDASVDIVAGTANLNAADGIGSGDALETQIGTLNTNNTTTGNVEIDNYGDMTAASVVNDGGDVEISVHSDLRVDYIAAVGNSVTLSADGAIVNANTDVSVDIIADALDLEALEGIGSDTALDTQVDTLNASNADANDIRINNTGDLTVEDVTNEGGDVSIATDADLILEYVEADGNTVTLSAVGAIIDDDADVDILADTASLNAGNGIGSGDLLETEIDSLSALNTTANSIEIDNDGDLTLTNVVNQAGTVDINVHSDLTVEHVEATGSTVILTASGAIIDGGDADADITATTADLSAADGIGSGDALETAISTLNATNSTTGNVEIANTGGDLAVKNVTTASAVVLSTDGTITDGGDDKIDIVADTADLSAVDIASGNALETQLNSLTAHASSGNVYINEADGITLQDIQVVGSTIDIVTNGDTIVYNMVSEGPAPGAKEIYLDVNNGDLTVGDSATPAMGRVRAECFGSADAVVDFDIFNGDLNVINGSVINASTTNPSQATVDLNVSGSVGLDGTSQILAESWNSGQATVNIEAGGNLSVTDNSSIAASILNGIAATVDGEASVYITVDGSANIGNGSSIASLVEAGSAGFTDGHSAAKVELYAGTGIDINTDGAEALSAVIGSNGIGDGEASIVAISDNGDLNVTNSEIRAQVYGDGYANLILGSALGNINIDPSVVESLVSGNGFAETYILALDGDVDLKESVIRAQVSGTEETSFAGVTLMAKNGSISADALSSIISEFALFLASFNIGTALSPINTAVDYLSGFSWEIGDIHINEAGDVGIGFCLEDNGTITLGISVIAQDGTIHITSTGNMTANSVISFNGGVSLESTQGSVNPGLGLNPFTGTRDIGYLPDGFDSSDTYELPYYIDSSIGPNVIEFGQLTPVLAVPVITTVVNPVNDLALLSDQLRFRIPSKNEVDTLQISYTQGFDALAGLGGVYFYHPIVEIGMYDVTGLGVDMYQFIDNNLSTTNPALLPTLGEDEEA